MPKLYKADAVFDELSRILGRKAAERILQKIGARRTSKGIVLDETARYRLEGLLVGLLGGRAAERILSLLEPIEVEEKKPTPPPQQPKQQAAAEHAAARQAGQPSTTGATSEQQRAREARVALLEQLTDILDPDRLATESIKLVDPLEVYMMVTKSRFITSERVEVPGGAETVRRILSFAGSRGVYYIRVRFSDGEARLLVGDGKLYAAYLERDGSKYVGTDAVIELAKIRGQVEVAVFQVPPEVAP